MQITKFYMKGCSPCSAVNRVLKELEEDWIKLPEIKEIEMTSPKAQAKYIMIYNLANVPTLIFYKDDGTEKGRLEGYIKKEQIEEMLNK